jgi:predicted DNA-binding protein with PD1-like motif
VFVVQVEPGQEVLATVTEQAAALGIQNGAIVSLVGAVGSAGISNMPKGDAGSDVLTEYEQPMEMSGTGEIRDGRPHIHCVLGTEGDTALSGHLHWARVDHWFVRVYLLASP